MHFLIIGVFFSKIWLLAILLKSSKIVSRKRNKGFRTAWEREAYRTFMGYD